MWLDKCQWAKSCFTFVAELKSTTQAQQPLFATITLLRVKNKFRWLNCCINYLYTVFSIFCILLIMQEKITSLMQFTTLVWNQDVFMDRIGSFVLSASITAIITQYTSKKIKLTSIYCQFLSIELTVGYFFGFVYEVSSRWPSLLQQSKNHLLPGEIVNAFICMCLCVCVYSCVELMTCPGSYSLTHPLVPLTRINRMENALLRSRRSFQHSRSCTWKANAGPEMDMP